MSLSAEVLAAKILVVDDLEVDARLVQAALAGSGFSAVTSTTDPRGVCELHRGNAYDLIILDLLMPEMDGFEVMAALKQREPGGYLPILAITASPDLMVRALESGARDYVNKPLRIRELVTRVANLVEISLVIKERREQSHALTRIVEDRTERLWEQAEIFRLFATHVPEGLVIRGVADRTVRYVNPAWHRLTGCALAMGDPIEKAVLSAHPDDRERLAAAMAKHPLGGADVEVRFVPREDEVRWSHIRTFPIADARGNVVWIAGILQDITVRKALEDQRRLHSALVEHSSVGIYVIEGGRFAYVNPRMCQMLGYAARELVGIDVIDIVIDEDKPRVAAQRARRAAGDVESHVTSFRLRRRDGSVLHLAVEGCVLEQQGRKVIFGMAHDLGDRIHARDLLIEAESHYQALVQQSVVGICLLDKSRLIHANPRLCEMLGYTMEELLTLDLRELVDAADRHLIDRVTARREAGETGSIAMELRALHKDGRLLHLGFESKIIDLARRKVSIGVVQDVTERAQSARLLRESEERYRQRLLEVQEEERRAISLELHDDVGQSLIALKIGLHRLGIGLVPEKAPLLAECMSVSDSVRDSVRKLAARLHPPQLEQLGLHNALRGLVDQHRDMTGLLIRYSFAGLLQRRLPAPLEAACYRICQEALNNATRHAQANAIDVELAAGSGELRLEVRDDGVGFDEIGDREAVLRSGSLGLFSMQERARLAGGALSIRSAAGLGTRVQAVFPT